MVTTLHLSELQNCHRRASARDVRGWLLCAASSAAAASFSLKNKGHVRGRAAKAIRKCRRMPLSERAGLRLKVSGISRSPALSQQGSQDATWAKVRRLQVSWFSALAPFNPSLFMYVHPPRANYSRLLRSERCLQAALERLLHCYDN